MICTVVIGSYRIDSRALHLDEATYKYVLLLAAAMESVMVLVICDTEQSEACRPAKAKRCYRRCLA